MKKLILLATLFIALAGAVFAAPVLDAERGLEVRGPEAIMSQRGPAHRRHRRWQRRVRRHRIHVMHSRRRGHVPPPPERRRP